MGSAGNQTVIDGTKALPGSLRSGPDKRLPLLWRAFFASAMIMVGAAALLVLTPVTIHASVTSGQLGLILSGLALMLLANLWMLRRVLAPLRKLTALMKQIDPDRPGERVTDIGAYGPDVAALSNAFNRMLDRLERERNESARAALEAQEGERQRLAAELHDEIGQTLTAAAIQIEHAADSGHDSPADLRRIAAVVRGSLDEVRRIARELRPEALDDLGLVNALISLCSRLSSQGDLRIVRRIQKLPDLSPELELVIYRIAQESLTNVVRHAQASQATLSLNATPHTATLSIVDDGRGLPPDLPARTAGISGMRERARLAHGKLEIDSKPSHGTAVTVELPWEAPDASPA